MRTKRIPYIVYGLLTVIFVLMSSAAIADDLKIDRMNANGTPGFMNGDLGTITPSSDAGFALGPPATRSVAADQTLSNSVQSFINDFVEAHYTPAGSEQMILLDQEVDGLGKVHTRFGQTINGLTVDGARLMVHSNAVTGTVYAVNGEFFHDHNLPQTAQVSSSASLAGALRSQGITDYEVQQTAALSYVVTPSGDQAKLAWRTRVEYMHEQERHIDDVYVDAMNGDFITSHAKVHPIRIVRTHDANFRTVRPGTLVCTDNQRCPSTVAQTAHDNASDTYDYMREIFGRDSLDNRGFALISTVNYRESAGTPYNNAFWDGRQMTYGDGDGRVFDPLGNAFDVVSHEFGHGVTTNESDLIYRNESGALNEALSYVLAAGAEAWRDGEITNDTWLLGEDIFTPGTRGDALRYLNDPTRDRNGPSDQLYSRDYYPDRYLGSSDNGGVHVNSGIANLAFYLLVEGGRHPQGKSTVDVPEIGMSKVEQIIYRTNTTYLRPSSNFSAMRSATVRAAADLYGQEEVDAVHDAWCAVGVPGCPVDPVESITLENGVSLNGQDASTGDLLSYTFEVPEGATNLVVRTTGSDPDADLYVRFGTAPTLEAFDCRSWTATSNEVCEVAAPSAGSWYVLINAYSTFNNLSITASWETAGGPSPEPEPEPEPCLLYTSDAADE